MSNFWNESVSEYDMISEDAENAEVVAEAIAESIVEEMEAEEPEIVEATEDQLQEIVEQSAYELNDKESNVIYNARLRLEQAKLYEMLINHSLFEGVDASPDAIKIVESELKYYIVKRLEVLLGIRKPKKIITQSVNENNMDISVELPFNNVEVDFLKQLARKGTLGQSAKDHTPAVVKPKSSLNPLPSIKPVASKPPAMKLKAEAPPVQAKTVEPAPPVQKTVVKPTQPVAKPAAKPQKNNTEPAVKKPKISSGHAVSKRPLTKQEILALAKSDLEQMKNRKPISKLKGKEKIELMKEVNERHKKKVKNGGAPFMDAKQLEMQYLTREANGRSPESVINGMVKNILSNSKVKIGE
jgi:hypothetical protein